MMAFFICNSYTQLGIMLIKHIHNAALAQL